jgi:hypothetical protein
MTTITMMSNPEDILASLEAEVEAKFKPVNIIFCAACNKVGEPMTFNTKLDLEAHEKKCKNHAKIAKPDFICQYCPKILPGDNQRNIDTHEKKCKAEHYARAQKNIDKINELLKLVPKEMLGSIIIPQ